MKLFKKQQDYKLKKKKISSKWKKYLEQNCVRLIMNKGVKCGSIALKSRAPVVLSCTTHGENKTTVIISCCAGGIHKAEQRLCSKRMSKSIPEKRKKKRRKKKEKKRKKKKKKKKKTKKK